MCARAPLREKWLCWAYVNKKLVLSDELFITVSNKEDGFHGYGSTVHIVLLLITSKGIIWCLQISRIKTQMPNPYIFQISSEDIIWFLWHVKYVDIVNRLLRVSYPIVQYVSQIVWFLCSAGSPHKIRIYAWWIKSTRTSSIMYPTVLITEVQVDNYLQLTARSTQTQ